MEMSFLLTQTHSSLQEHRLKSEQHPSAYRQASNEHQDTSSASTQSALSFISELKACLLKSKQMHKKASDSGVVSVTHITQQKVTKQIKHSVW